MPLFIEVSECATNPANGGPGMMYVSRVYGPYTESGAARTSARILSEVAGRVITYPATGVRYVTDGPDTRVVRILARLPYGRTARRNYPRTDDTGTLDCRMGGTARITGNNHSSDRATVYTGAAAPYRVCGFHASQL